MKAKCPYCHAEFNSPSIYNSLRNKGGEICFEPGSAHGYIMCHFCSQVFAYQTYFDRGWEKIMAVTALSNEQRPWGVYDGHKVDRNEHKN